MKEHRVRAARSTDGNPKPHLFVELEPDRWIEVVELPLHAEIHNSIKAWEWRGPICYAERAFRIGIVKDWEEQEPIV